MDDDDDWYEEPLTVGSAEGVNDRAPGRLDNCRSVSRAARAALDEHGERPRTIGFHIPGVR